MRINFVVILISAYQRLKPVLHQVNLTVFGVAPTCKYSKSCSQYTIEMIKKHGTISGLYLGWQRVLSCWQ